MYLDELKSKATQYIKSYVSFESALLEHGISDDGPLTLQCATLFCGFRKKINGEFVEYTSLPEDYFFGYKKINNSLIAEPEKALLDYIHYCEEKGLAVKLHEFDLEDLDFKKLFQYADNMSIGIKDYLDDFIKQVDEKTYPKYKLFADIVKNKLDYKLENKLKTCSKKSNKH